MNGLCVVGWRQCGSTSLMLATLGRHAKVVEVLLKHGATVSIKNNVGSNIVIVSMFEWLGCLSGLLSYAGYFHQLLSPLSSNPPYTSSDFCFPLVTIHFA